MKLALRIVLLIIIIPPVAFLLSSVFSMLLILTGLHQSTFALPIVEVFGVIATVPVGVFVLKARVDNTAVGLGTAVRIGAIVVGSIGFIGGIVWMEIYYPEGDMNFLMGPIAGSFGSVIGAVGGLFYWMFLRIVKDKK